MQEFTVDGDPLIGTLVGGRYRVVRKLREGGMGVVYQARHEIIEKMFALKVLSRDATARPDLSERFLREARAVAAIAHDHVLSANDFGRDENGLVYFATELLEGRDLNDEIRINGRMAPRRAAKIVCQMLRGIAAAHAQGVVHRDLKPENIFLMVRDGDHDFVKVLDFGLAKVEGVERLTAPGQVVGTPEFFSPEQGLGQNVDARSDLYSVGCILYAMLTGRPPFMAVDPYEVMMGHVKQEPRAPSAQLPGAGIPLALDHFVGKALAKPVNARFQTAEEMRAALEVLLPNLSDQVKSASGHLMVPHPVSTTNTHTPLPPPAAPSDWTAPYHQVTPPAVPLLPPQLVAKALEPPPKRKPPARVGRDQWLALGGGALAALIMGLVLLLMLKLLR